MVPLVQFGDHDGTGSDVLLQHPLGVVYASDKQIYVADSYNHKVTNHLLRLNRHVNFTSRNKINLLRTEIWMILRKSVQFFFS